MISLSIVTRFLKSIGEWAEGRKDIDCILLIGSYARGEQTNDSDIDLMILTENAESYLGNTVWIEEFGEPCSLIGEDWGDVQSLRVRYTDSKEVEFGIASPSWLADPLPVTTADVLERGYKVIFERKRIGLPERGYTRDLTSK